MVAMVAMVAMDAMDAMDAMRWVNAIDPALNPCYRGAFPFQDGTFDQLAHHRHVSRAQHAGYRHGSPFDALNSRTLFSSFQRK